MDIRVAVVGLGNMGKQHIEALTSLGLPGVTILVTTVSDARNDLISNAMAEFGVPHGQQDWKMAVASPAVDVVHVCTSNMSHFAISHEALSHGKHVVLEKPLAVSKGDAAKLRDLAADQGVVTAVNYTYRGYEAVHLARRLVNDGELGNVNVIRGGYLQDWLLSPQVWDWRLDPTLGGPSRAVADIGTHWMDLATFITGQKVRRLISDLHVIVPRRQGPPSRDANLDEPGPADWRVTTEDYASVLFHTDDARGAFTVSQMSPGHHNSLWLEIDGATGSLHWSSEDPDAFELRRGQERTRVVTSATMRTDAARSEVAGHGRALRRVLRSVYGAVHSLNPPPTGALLHADFEDGYYSAEILAAVLESARVGSWVDIPDRSSDRRDAEAMESPDASVPAAGFARQLHHPADSEEILG